MCCCCYQTKCLVVCCRDLHFCTVHCELRKHHQISRACVVAVIGMPCARRGHVNFVALRFVACVWTVFTWSVRIQKLYKEIILLIIIILVIGLNNFLLIFFLMWRKIMIRRVTTPMRATTSFVLSLGPPAACLLKWTKLSCALCRIHDNSNSCRVHDFYWTDIKILIHMY